MKIGRIEQFGGFQTHKAGKMQQPAVPMGPVSRSSVALPVTMLPAQMVKSHFVRFGTAATTSPASELDDDDAVNLWDDSIDSLPKAVSKALVDAFGREPVLLTVGHLLLEMWNNPDSRRELEKVLKEKLKVPPQAFREKLAEWVGRINKDLDSQSDRQSGGQDKKQARFDASLVEVFKILKTFKDQVPDAGPGNAPKLNLETFMMAVVAQGASESARLMRGMSSITELSPEKMDKDESPLEYFSRDVTFAAANNELPPVIGRDKEFQQLLNILGMTNTPNPLLVGEPGVGKTALVEKLAQYLVKGENIPPKLQRTDSDGRVYRDPQGRPLGKRILEINWSKIEAESKNPNDFKKFVQEIVEEAKARRGEVLLFVDEIHRINDKLSINRSADMLKPPLARGEISLIGATTHAENREYIEKDDALKSRFEVITVNEPTVPEALTMLRGARRWYENRHAVLDQERNVMEPLIIRDDALSAAIEKAKRYQGGEFLPRSAFKLLDYACSKVNTEHAIGSFKRLMLEGQATQLRIDIEEGLKRRVAQLDRDHESLKERHEKAFDGLQAAVLAYTNTAAAKEQFPALETVKKSSRSFAYQVRCQLEAMERGTPFTHEPGQNDAEHLIRQVVAAYDDSQQKSVGKAPLKEVSTLYKQLDGAARLHKQAKEELAEKEAKLKAVQEEIPDAVTMRTVGIDDIIQAVEQKTGIPVSTKEAGRKEKIQNMEPRLRERLIGQHKAVKSVSSAILRNESGLRDPNRPIGSFLFLGPTGVGKTELAKTLAEFLFDDEKAMVRFDMSEFQEAHNVSRLKGAPPGYIGYEEGGELTNAIKENPYRVVLFDEIEKAHPKVFDLLLQILEDGRLTSGKGEEVSFKDCIIILTSNVGSREMMVPFQNSGNKLSPTSGAFQEKYEEMDRIARLELKKDKRFRPEFLNRFDDIVVFHPLMQAHIRQISDVMTRKLNKELQTQRLTVKLDDATQNFLVDKCSDFENGGRPLRRYIDKVIKTAIGKRLLKEEIVPGETIVVNRPLIEQWDKEFESEGKQEGKA